MPSPRILTGPTLTYAANAKQTEKLDRGYVIREIALTLTAEITTDGTDAITAATIQAAGLWGLVQNLRLKLNSNTNIRDISGDQLKLLNYFYYNLGDFEDEQTLVMPISTTRTISSTLILPLWMVDSAQPIDTQLDATLLSALELQVDWGDITNVLSGAPAASATLSADPYIQVGTLNTYGVKGPFNTQLVTAEEFVVSGANSRYQVELATGNLYRSFMIGAKTDAGADAPGFIDNIRVFSGGTDYFNLPTDMWQAWSRRRERNVQQMNDGSGKFVSSQRDMDAWYYVDMVTDGYLSECINAIGLSTLKIELDINTAIESLQIIKQEMVPLAAPVRAG